MRDQKSSPTYILHKNIIGNRLVKSKFASGPGNLAKIKPEKTEIRRLDQFFLADFRSKKTEKIIQTTNFRFFRLDFRRVPTGIPGPDSRIIITLIQEEHNSVPLPENRSDVLVAVRQLLVEVLERINYSQFSSLIKSGLWIIWTLAEGGLSNIRWLYSLYNMKIHSSIKHCYS